MKRLHFAWVAVIGIGGLLASGFSSLAQDVLTYRDLVNRMLDLEQLAVLPQAGERCAQWSSYDRASRYDEATGRYVHWGANDDGPQFIRRENGMMVLAEMEGPGCIWRIWSARAEKGRVKIYLDGQEKPAVDLPFVHYFDGKTPPFDYPMLSYNLNEHGSSGQNLYFPIPYQKSCKILAEEGWGRYYHFVYTTFPPGTKVPTFSAELGAEHAEDLRRVNDFFAGRLGEDPKGKRPGELTESGTLSLLPGERAELVLEGPRAITALRGKVYTKNREDQMAALRKVILRITWDDQPQPAVWVPVGDFFGTAPGENHYRSLVTGMTPEGWYAYWYMPFEKKAVLELINEDKVTRELWYEVVHAPVTRPVEEMGYFHCKWHRGVHEVPPDRWPDWVMLRTEGRGRYCGVMLHVWNPLGDWWGEGDEKFFVDGEKFPSTFGTGSEDYFGYAWCHPGLFQRAYHGQTMTQNNRGHQSVFRWHVVDNVPFRKSFEAAIEKYFDVEERGTEYACTAVWYQVPGGVDPYGPVPVTNRHDYYRIPTRKAGGFAILGNPPGNVRTQHMGNFRGGKWQNNDQLWWTDAKPGDKLQLIVPVRQGGRYRVGVVLTKARDYAIVQLYLNGKKAGEPIDLYNPEVVNTSLIPLGVFELPAGENVLTVEIVGKNPEAIPAYMFGLDYLGFEPVD
jgi:hypothetical protein